MLACVRRKTRVQLEVVFDQEKYDYDNQTTKERVVADGVGVCFFKVAFNKKLPS